MVLFLSFSHLRLIESYITLRKGQGNPIQVSNICNPRRGFLSCGCFKSLTRGWDTRVHRNVVIDYHPHSCVKNVQAMSKTHTRRDFSILFGVDALWRHRRVTSGMGLTLCDVIGDLLSEWACLILQGGTNWIYNHMAERTRDPIRGSMICNHENEHVVSLSLPQCGGWLFFSHAFSSSWKARF